MKAITYVGYIIGCIAIGVVTGILSRLIWRKMEERRLRRQIRHEEV